MYWIVNLGGRAVEVYTDPSPEGYATQRDYRSRRCHPRRDRRSQSLGQIAVNDILPPKPAEGNGA